MSKRDPKDYEYDDYMIIGLLSLFLAPLILIKYTIGLPFYLLGKAFDKVWKHV